MESRSGPRAARSIGKVSGVERTRVTGTLIATYTTITAYSSQPARERLKQKSRKANSSATRTSCQNNAMGIHADNSMWRPARLNTWARIRTPKRLNAFNGRSIGSRNEIDSFQKQNGDNGSAAMPAPDPVVHQHTARRRIAIDRRPISDE